MLSKDNIERKMGMILDIIIIGLMALSIFLGYKKGLVKVAVKLCAFIIAVVVTLAFYKPASNLIIENTGIDEQIESIIIENGTKKLEETNQENQENFLENIQGYLGNAVTQTQNQIVENAAKQISTRVINIFVIIGLFIATRLALVALVFISDLITNLPIIKQFNELGGGIYGAVRGLALIYVILAVVFFIVSMTANSGILSIIDESIVTKFMYNNNILLNIIF